MKVEFNLKYHSPWDNNNKPLTITEGVISGLLYVKWNYEGIDHELIHDKDNNISSLYISQKFIIVCYSSKSINNTFPNNLVMYNLKKEIIKRIPPPVPINWDRISPVHGMGEIEELDGEKYLSVGILTDNYFINDGNLMGLIEIRWLNLNTFEYHPTKNDLIKDFGR